MAFGTPSSGYATGYGGAALNTGQAQQAAQDARGARSAAAAAEAKAKADTRARGDRRKQKRKDKKNKGNSGSGGNSGGNSAGGGSNPVNPLLDPSNFNPSTAQVSAAVNSAADIKYNPALSDIGSQLTSARQFQGDISGWYNEYRNALQSARDSTAAFYQGVAAAGGQAPLAQPTGNPLEDGAAQNRQALGNMFNGAMVAQGANNVANYDSKTANSRLLEGGSHIQQQRNIDSIKKTRAQTKQEKGDYKNTYAMDLHDKLANNLLAAKAFNLDVTAEQNRHGEAIKQMQTDARNSGLDFKAKYGLTRGQMAGMSKDALRAWNKSWNKSPKTPTSALDKSKLAYFKQHGYFPPTGPPKAKSGNGKDQYGNTPKQVRDNNNDWKQAKSYLAGHKGEANSSSVVQTLVTGFLIPQDIAEYAVNRARHGGKVSAKVAKQLRALGIDVPMSHILGQGAQGTTHSPGDYGNSHRGG